MRQTEHKIQIEKDLSKQIDQFDEHAERSGWLYLVVLIAFLFVGLALFMYFSNSIPNKNTATIEEMGQRIEKLESRVQTLEQQLEKQ